MGSNETIYAQNTDCGVIHRHDRLFCQIFFRSADEIKSFHACEKSMPAIVVVRSTDKSQYP